MKGYTDGGQSVQQRRKQTKRQSILAHCCSNDGRYYNNVQVATVFYYNNVLGPTVAYYNIVVVVTLFTTTMCE